MVVCVDEKTAVQALDRTQPVLPLLPHTPERHTHDYVRHGTIDLFAALEPGDGGGHPPSSPPATGRWSSASSWTSSTARSPQSSRVHVVLDNSSTHKTPAIQRWLVRHPRVTPSTSQAPCGRPTVSWSKNQTI